MEKRRMESHPPCINNDITIYFLRRDTAKKRDETGCQLVGWDEQRLMVCPFFACLILVLLPLVSFDRDDSTSQRERRRTRVMHA
jgi:hypothetical protein